MVEAFQNQSLSRFLLDVTSYNLVWTLSMLLALETIRGSEFAFSPFQRVSYGVSAALCQDSMETQTRMDLQDVGT